MSRLPWIAIGAIGLIAATLTFVINRSVHQPVAARQAVSAQMSATPTPIASDPTVHSKLTPPWVGRRQPAWGVDGSKTIAFTLDASNDLPIGTARSRPQLVARCVARQVELFVVTGPLTMERQSTTHTVRVQIDHDPEQPEQWLASESSQEVFTPDGLGTLRRLARAHRMRFNYLPFGAQPFTADFVLDGFDQLAPLVARTCGTRLDPAPRQKPVRTN